MPDAFSSNRDAALEYAARFRWHVFPVQPSPDGECTCVKGEACPHPGKHPDFDLTRHGFKDASPYQDSIKSWWDRKPGAKVGLRCGALSSVVVVDVDPRNGADESLRGLDTAHGPIPETVESLTGGGGRHLFFRHPGGKVANAVLAPGVELKGDESCVTLPPSLHASGRNYAWCKGRSPWDLQPAKLPAWVLVSLARGSETVQSPRSEPIPRGQRRRRLLQLGAVMRARGTTLEAIEMTLREENERRCDPSWGGTELCRKLGGILSTLRRYRGPLAKDDPAAWSDTGNAARLAAMFGDRIRWCGLRASWYVFDGTRWVVDHGRQVEGHAKDLARILLAEVAAIEDEAERKRPWLLAQKAAKGTGIRDMVGLARSEPGIPVDPANFDRDPYLLNTPSGTLDLRTMQMRDHDPADLITMVAGAPYDPDARSEEWERTLEHALPDPEVRDFFHRLCGSFLEGTAQDDIVVTIHGPTNTGKSTVLRAVAAAMGHYARSTEYATFATHEKRAGRATPELAPLVGRRLVLAFEGGKSVELDAERIKQLSSGDPGSVRDVHKSEEEMHARFKIVLVSNFRPTVKGDPALWRRLKEVPFSHGVEKPDLMLRDRLQHDPAIRAAVLAWMVHGYAEYTARGLEQPAAVTAATNEFRREADAVEDFIDGKCAIEEDAFTPTEALRKACSAWAEEAGKKPLEWGEVAERLKGRLGNLYRLDRGRAGGRQIRGWYNLRLTDAPEQLATEAAP